MIHEEIVQHDDVFRIGRVSSVQGRRVRIEVDKLKNGSHLLYRGEIIRNVGVGGYVKIVKGFVEIVAKVDGEFIDEDKRASSNYRRAVDPLRRTLDVSLVGFIAAGAFERGVRELPLLDNECYILTRAEFESIHRFVASTDKGVTIGALATEPTQPVAVGANAIFASHVGIFGNTGSGKSYTLAKLYHELFKRFGSEPGFAERSQFLLIDFNGEYVDRPGEPGEPGTAVIAQRPLKQAYVLSTRLKGGGDKLPLPRSTVQDHVFWTVLLDATEKTQAPFIRRVLTSTYWEDLIPDASALLKVIGSLVCRATKATDPTIDRQLPIHFLEEVQACLGRAATDEFTAVIEDFRAHLVMYTKTSTYFWDSGTGARSTLWANGDGWDAHIIAKFQGLKMDFTSIGDVDLVRFKLVMQYYSDIIGGFANRDHLGPLIKRMTVRIPDIKKLIRVEDKALSAAPLTVVSLRDVNLDMRKVIPMVLCKHIYDQKKAADLESERHLNLIIDEAHNILSTQSSRESDAWRDYRLETFEEIVKEGRKFGVFMTIASQRPHDISETIISQLHNYFLHRLVNNLDVLAIQRAVAYLDAVSFESLPILATGTCVLAGVSAQVPVIVKIGGLPAQAAPNSTTMSVTDAWAAKPLPISAA